MCRIIPRWGSLRWGAGQPGGTRGTPGTVRGGGVSESVAKALRDGIGREKKRGISTILFRRSGTIGAFATDLDKLRPRGPLPGTRSARRRPRRAPRRPDGTREYTARRSDGPCLRSPERLLRRKVHFAFESAVPTVILECKIHISANTSWPDDGIGGRHRAPPDRKCCAGELEPASPFLASAQVSSRTRTSQPRVRLGTCALAEVGGTSMTTLRVARRNLRAREVGCPAGAGASLRPPRAPCPPQLAPSGTTSMTPIPKPVCEPTLA